MSLKQAQNLVQDLITSDKYFTVEYDSAQTIKGLTKIPVTSTYVFSNAPQYQMFSGAQKEGNLKIKETGTVKELEILNQSQYPVFIPCGSVFVSQERGKQDRTIITDMMVDKGKTRIPVACVEKGRWSGRSSYVADRIFKNIERNRGSDFALHSLVPMRVARSLQASTTKYLMSSGGPSRFQADQGEVWSSVDEEIEQADAKNPTSSLTEVQLKRDKEPKVKFEIYENEIGDIFVGQGMVLSMELYHSPKTWQSLAEETIKRYKSSLYRQKEQPKREVVDGFLANMGKCKPVAVKSVGLGYDVRLTEGKVDGSCLVVSQTPIHFTAMPGREKKKDVLYSDFPRRRGPSTIGIPIISEERSEAEIIELLRGRGTIEGCFGGPYDEVIGGEHGNGCFGGYGRTPDLIIRKGPPTKNLSLDNRIERKIMGF